MKALILMKIQRFRIRAESVFAGGRLAPDFADYPARRNLAAA